VHESAARIVNSNLALLPLATRLALERGVVGSLTVDLAGPAGRPAIRLKDGRTVQIHAANDPAAAAEATVARLVASGPLAHLIVIGAGLGAVAGVMVGTYYGIAHYQMGFLLGLKAFSAAVLGGIGNLAGAVLGGILMGLIEALGAGYIGDFTNVCFLDQWLPGFADVCAASPESSLFGSNYKDVYAFIVLILVLVFRPQGLLGERVGDRA